MTVGAVSGVGAVWVFQGPLAGEHYTTTADDRVLGDGSQARLGSTLAAGNLDGMGRDDLVIGGTVAAAGDGAVWIFTIE